ncbi:Transcriptional regulator, TetR family [Caenispirillum salinarum AK4]|uniref:Transcriptional regulator, TetR family n=1 Tax=Caenispirillum salinarum AK4 TaxID=1238182 RepID=K9GS96_9PROT|nr:Transcriptional regulator, TetR family [Caenispirillum salinarum AK4]
MVQYGTEDPAMVGKGETTRDRILEAAEAAVLAKGFGATSIDELIAAVGITKNGFFYHFRDKNELARALLLRYLEREEAILDDLFARARTLSDDPLHAFLVGLKLFAELMEDLPEGHPGCLVATYCYQERLFDAEVRALNRRIVAGWRARFRALLEDIAATYPMRETVDLDDLADTVSAIVEGGLVLGRAMGDHYILPRQVMVLRSFVKLLFAPHSQPVAAS